MKENIPGRTREINEGLEDKTFPTKNIETAAVTANIIQEMAYNIITRSFLVLYHEKSHFASKPIMIIFSRFVISTTSLICQHSIQMLE